LWWGCDWTARDLVFFCYWFDLFVKLGFLLYILDIWVGAWWWWLCVDYIIYFLIKYKI